MIPSEGCILVASSDAATRFELERALDARGIAVQASPACDPLPEVVAGVGPRAVLLDGPPEAIERLCAASPGLPVVAVGRVSRASDVVSRLRAGATDFVATPCEPRELERVLASLDRRPPCPDRDRGGPAMQRLWATAERVAPTDVTVLITGESGSGKEHLAEWVRMRSQRAGRPFVKVNCAALPHGLLESELFGYERGAFTGAETRKPGKFELADGGTLFLDEVSEMPPELQAKLLQVLQEGRFSRLGGQRDVCVNVRVLAATHRDLCAAVRAGTFRQDLYYRLAVVRLRVPPLRERSDEILPLAEACLERFAADLGRACPPLPDSLRRAFVGYAWPGNVRELDNMVRRWAVLEREEPVLEALAAKPLVAGSEGPGGGVEAPRDGQLARFLAGEVESVSLLEVGREAATRAERRAIHQMLERTRWNRRRTAAALKVSYKALLYKMKDAGLGSES